MHSSLSAVLDRARAAVLACSITTSPHAEGAPPKEPGALPGAIGGVVEARLRLTSTLRPNAAPAPYVWLKVPAAPPQPAYTPLEALTAGHNLKAGPRRLFELLHSNTLEAVRARAYGVTPSQGTIHQPQELLARALGCHVVTVWRWTLILKAAGLIDARAHYTDSRGTTRTDGTLYAVALTPGHRAHLTYDDLSHSWRDLDADRQAGRTAWAAMQEDLQGGSGNLISSRPDLTSGGLNFRPSHQQCAARPGEPSTDSIFECERGQSFECAGGGSKRGRAEPEILVPVAVS